MSVLVVYLKMYSQLLFAKGENGLYSEVGKILCVQKSFEVKYIYIFINCGKTNEAEDFNMVIMLLLGKQHIGHTLLFQAEYFMSSYRS